LEPVDASGMNAGSIAVLRQSPARAGKFASIGPGGALAQGTQFLYREILRLPESRRVGKTGSGTMAIQKRDGRCFRAVVSALTAAESNPVRHWASSSFRPGAG
jgi:hypothetical protein